MVFYVSIGIIVLSVVDFAIKVRKTIAYIMGMKLGRHMIMQAENKELKQEVKQERKQLQVAGQTVERLRFETEQPTSVQVTKNFVPYDPLAHHQAVITDALLIFDTAMSGQRCSREAMCPAKLSHDRWEGGRDWLVGAKILEYKTKKSVVWHTTDRRVARGMLTLYASKHTTSTPS